MTEKASGPARSAGSVSRSPARSHRSSGRVKSSQLFQRRNRPTKTPTPLTTIAAHTTTQPANSPKAPRTSVCTR